MMNVITINEPSPRQERRKNQQNNFQLINVALHSLSKAAVAIAIAAIPPHCSALPEGIRKTLGRSVVGAVRKVKAFQAGASMCRPVKPVKSVQNVYSKYYNPIDLRGQFVV